MSSIKTMGNHFVEDSKTMRSAGCTLTFIQTGALLMNFFVNILPNRRIYHLNFSLLLFYNEEI